MVARSRIEVEGVVQGVGFRPFVYQLAAHLGLAGWVANTSRGVTIEVEGEPKRLDEFALRLRREAPPLSVVRRVSCQQMLPAGHVGFSIVESRSAETPASVLPADVAICPACAREMDDPSDRRHGYPFINCTNCGPRFTIVQGIPYDRERTTMSAFTMCPQCAREYADPTTRRFHAEPNACPACGPHVWAGNDPDTPTVDGGAAIEWAAQQLRRGAVLAIKGLGGFHLACDARNHAAVSKLRRRKHRWAKPLAVMCASLEEARRIATIDPAEEPHLQSPQSPILLLRKSQGYNLDPAVAPDNLYVGVMLPYTPLHRLLFRQAPPTLVMTSGNLSEEPIAHENREAHQRLAPLADGFLWHNRPIHTPCDDSVARVFQGELCLVRRSRGFVPVSLSLPLPGPDLLACGAEQKNTFCLARGDAAILSQHIGDMDNVQTADYFQRAVQHFLSLFRAQPRVLAHDLHPGYEATRYALREANRFGARTIGVQHHHAHVAACMAEHQLDGQVVGVAFDGTGYGTDGALWGGEVLLAGYEQFRRAGMLRYVRLPGGEAAIRRPYRMAYAYLLDALGPQEAARVAHALLPDLSEEEAAAVQAQCATGFNSPLTSSMGRLFDAASALLGFRGVADYEGHAAVHLEMICAEPSAAPAQPLPYRLTMDEGTWVLDARPAIRALVALATDGVPAAALADLFHAMVAEATADICARVADQVGEDRVCLGGGCFQNVNLLAKVVARLRDAGLTPYWPRGVPANDGGLSLGQAAVARAMVLAERSAC